MTQQATYTIDSTIIFWGGIYVSGYEGSVNETTLIYYGMETNTAELYDGYPGMQTRIQASGFVHNGKFCIQGGMDVDYNPIMDIWCFNKGEFFLIFMP